MDDDTPLPFDLSAVARKKATATFDGGRLSSDGGVLLLRGVERRLGLAQLLAGCIVDRRDPSRIDHKIVEMLRLRMFLIAAGYEDADDCDNLGTDPAFKMAVGRLPDTGRGCAQPSMIFFPIGEARLCKGLSQVLRNARVDPDAPVADPSARALRSCETKPAA